MTDETETTNTPELILKRLDDLRNDNKFTREALLTFGRAGLSEKHARAYAEALEQAVRSDRDATFTLMWIESRLDEQELRRKAFWRAANNIGPMLFFSVALGVMLAWRKINADVDWSKTPNGRYGYRSQPS